MGATSDNEDESTDIPVLEILQQSVKSLSDLMVRAVPKTSIPNSHNTQITVPLGHLRLRITEMVFLLIKLKKQNILDALVTSEVFG